MTTENEVRNGLRHLPDTLLDAYRQLYELILAQQPEARQRAINAFRWIKFSCEPVRSEMLLDAVSVDVSPAGEFSHEPIQPNVLLKACQNLIILDKSLNVFRFAHLSVDEFFDGELSLEDSHTEIAQACLSLICTPRQWEGYDSSVTTRAGQYEDRHLLLYSAAFWPWHFARAKDCQILDTIWDAYVSGTSHRRWCEYSSEKVEHKAWNSSGVLWGRVGAHREQKDIILSCVCVFDISRKFDKIFDSCPPSLIHMNALLSAACYFGDLEIWRLLIEKGAEFSVADTSGRTPLHYASSGGNEEVARLLIDKGAEISAVDNEGGTPLHCALDSRNEELVRLLIDKGASATAANKDGRTPLHRLLDCGSEELVRLVIEKGADVTAADKDGRTPLHRALDWGNEELVRLLTDKGADVTAADKDERTPLHRSLDWGNEKVVRALVEKGADVTAADKNGRTPLHRALDWGNETLVRILTDKGADVTTADKDGRTPLHRSLDWGNEKLVRVLVEKGADVTAADKNGRTPHHRALDWGNETLARLLTDKGADVTAADNDGPTPVDLALSVGNKGVA